MHLIGSGKAAWSKNDFVKPGSGKTPFGIAKSRLKGGLSQAQFSPRQDCFFSLCFALFRGPFPARQARPPGARGQGATGGMGRLFPRLARPGA